MDAYSAGRQAWFEGLSIHSNPYIGRDDLEIAAMEWDDGWYSADDEEGTDDR